MIGVNHNNQIGGGSNTYKCIMSEDNSRIRAHFEGKSLFITGITGFCGRVFLEKIVRSLPGIDTVFVLIRGKGQLSPQERLNRLFSSKLFSFHTHSEKQLLKVIAIHGDITKDGLDIPDEVRQILYEKVHIVYHIAASVRFDATFRINYVINVIGTKNVVNFVQGMKRLESLVYMSTAYSNCHLKTIGEKLYPLPKDIDGLMEEMNQMDDQMLEKVATKYFDGRLNNYIFTKAMAEHVVDRYRRGIPTAIARPAIVAPSKAEPVPGWIDSFQGPAGFTTVFSLGIIQVTDWEFDYLPEVFPVDILANAMLAIPCYTLPTIENEIKVFNFTSSTLRLINNYSLLTKFREEMMKAPSLYVVRPFFLPPIKHNMSRAEFLIKCFFYHIVFAYIMDFLLLLAGQRRMMVHTVNKMHFAMKVMKYFANNDWNFDCGNFVKLIDVVSEQEPSTFTLDIRVPDIEESLRDTWLGVRRYLLQEDDSTIKVARIKYKVQSIVYNIYQMALFILLMKLVTMWIPLNFPPFNLIAPPWC